MARISGRKRKRNKLAGQGREIKPNLAVTTKEEERRQFLLTYGMVARYSGHTGSFYL